MTRRIRIVLLLGVIFIFSIVFVNADESGDSGENPANGVVTENAVQDHNEQQQDNGTQIKSLEAETASRNHTDAQATLRSAQRPPIYNSWVNENGNRYYADGNGNYVRGIYEIDGVIYFFDLNTGALKREAGWRTWGNGRYFTNGEGIAYRNRFITFGIPKYYMGSDGAVKTGIYSTHDGHLYNADDYTGEVIQVAHWIEKYGKRYFSNSVGELYKNQFITFGVPKFYMGSDGAVQTGIFTVNNGRLYNADDRTGEIIQKAQWIEKNGKRYFSNAEGALYKNQFITFGVPKFYMGSDGAVQTGIFTVNNGRLYNADDRTGEIIQKAQWIEKNGKRYFSNAAGELYKNQFISFGNTYYYMGSDGAVVVGSFYYNGESYTSNSEGIVNELTGPVGSSILGIDVSYAQGVIDWNKVANAGIKFAIIRAAFRGYGTGRIVTDEWFERNIKGATAAGIKVGVYFFSQAINETEGAEEADYIVNQIRNYKVTLPVVIDTEYVSDSRARGNLISKEIRTAAVKAFCERSLQRGYTPMIYASTSWLNNQLDMSKLSAYKVWVAQYYSRVTYNGKYHCWQYSSSGSVDGISNRVDMNYWYNR